MDRTKFLTVLVIVLLLINVGTLAYLFILKQDRQSQMPPMRQKGEPSEFIIKTLKFTPEQEEKFMVLRDDHRKQMKAINDSLKQVREEYFDALKSDSYDTLRNAQLNERIAHLEGKKHQITFDHFVLVRKLCTTEQQELFDGFIDEILRAMAPPRQGQRPPRDRRPPSME